MVALSQIKPDYEGILDQIIAGLSQRESWRGDLITASTGRTLMEVLAQIGAYNQLAIVRALQENNFDTARLESSLYAMTRTFGVHIQRRIPASAPYTLERLGSTQTALTIPPYSKFTMKGTPLFNEKALIFPIGETHIECTLHEGTVSQETFISTGVGFQNFTLGNAIPFAVSDKHIRCLSGSEEYVPVHDGPWNYKPDDTVFFENTLPDGSVEILFGTGYYGKVPAAGQAMTFLYVYTNGFSGNKSTDGFEVSCLDVVGVKGVPTGPLTGGDNHKDAEFYRVMAPSLRAAVGRAVTRPDYRAHIMTYPGVRDVVIRGQAENAPNDVRWQGVLALTILSVEEMDELEWDEFIAWLVTLGIAENHYIRQDPTPIVKDVTVNIYCFPHADLDLVKATSQTKIIGNMQPARGSLARIFAAEDISKWIRASFVKGTLDYIDVVTPAADIVPGPLEYVTLGTLTVNTYFTTRKATS